MKLVARSVEIKKAVLSKNGLGCGAEWIGSDWRSSHRLAELVYGFGHKKSHPAKNGFQKCGAEWIRTTDSRIFSPMLYQLSYSTKIRLAKVDNSAKRQNIN